MPKSKVALEAPHKRQYKTNDSHKCGISLYIHIPFCQRKCPYCDFNTYAGMEGRFAAYVGALTKDIEGEGARRARPRVRTVFIGGGTPTVLEPEHWSSMMEAVRTGFRLDPEAEITSEANPGTVDQTRFETLRRLGVNRLSMGVQSFDDEELAFLGRIHRADEAAAAFRLARSVGFANINLDFMFGLPHQRPETWRETLLRAIELDPEHLSLYSLTVDPGTPLAAWVARGQVSAPDPDLAADLYEMACQLLDEAGYHHYEVSNWARGPLGKDGLPRFACRHNLVYWRNEPYLGFGPGAHSWLDGARWSVARSVQGYIDALARGAAPLDYEERIDRELEMAETMMLGLRLLRVGVERAAFRARFGVDLADVYRQTIAELETRGLVELTPHRLRLAPRAWLLGNEVFAAFLPD
ncbi:MAG: radical SAM family heme chaperone HemW [Chloroflexi bacterium]|nr:radical SAM family heme chaperone HemW [Chloroflexota bacterium]